VERVAKASVVIGIENAAKELVGLNRDGFQIDLEDCQ
jgi:hypothetical protein